MKFVLMLFFIVLGVFTTLTPAQATGAGYRPLQGDSDCCGTGCIAACETGIVADVEDNDAAGGDASPSEPKKVEIKAVGVKFSPLVAYAEVGDTITWTNMAAHFVESVDVMSPADLKAFRSEMSIDFAIKVQSEGIITYKCPPHWGARMGGFIVVGEPDNVEGILEQYAETANNTPALKAAKGLVKKLRKDLKKNGHL